MERPKLRKVERFVQETGPERLLVLRDPLGLAEPVALPPAAAAILDMLDGSKTLAQVRQSLLLRGEQDLNAEDLEDLVADLDAGGWLDSDTFRALFDQTLTAWLDAPTRPAVAAGLLYPPDPDAAATELAQALGSQPRTTAGSDVVGVLVPHSPMRLGGPVMSATLRDLPEASSLDAIVVLATCHAPGLTPYVVTDKPYETPLGVTRVPAPLVETLERRLGWIRREEIRHRQGHAVELSVLLLQHLYGEACPEVLTVLCGQSILRDDVDDASAQADHFVVTLEALTEDLRVLFWGSAELSHGGLAYGRPALDQAGVAALESHDRACLDALQGGQEQRLASRCKESTPQGRPSGGAVLHSLHRLLGQRARPEIAAYRSVEVPGPASGRAGLAGVRFVRRG